MTDLYTTQRVLDILSKTGNDYVVIHMGVFHARHIVKFLNDYSYTPISLDGVDNVQKELIKSLQSLTTVSDTVSESRHYLNKIYDNTQQFFRVPKNFRMLMIIKHIVVREDDCGHLKKTGDPRVSQDDDWIVHILMFGWF